MLSFNQVTERFLLFIIIFHQISGSLKDIAENLYILSVFFFKNPKILFPAFDMFSFIYNIIDKSSKVAENYCFFCAFCVQLFSCASSDDKN